MSTKCYSCAIGETIEKEPHTPECRCYRTAVVTGIAMMIRAMKSGESPLFCAQCMTALEHIMKGLGHELTVDDVVKVGSETALGSLN